MREDQIDPAVLRDEYGDPIDPYFPPPRFKRVYAAEALRRLRRARTEKMSATKRTILIKQAEKLLEKEVGDVDGGFRTDNF